MQMGFGMEGTEDKIVGQVERVAARFEELTYVEIGVGFGGTLSAIASLLKGSGKRWRAVGIELPNGYSFNRDQTAGAVDRAGLELDFVTPTNGQLARPAWGRVTVYFKDSQSFLTEAWRDPIHLALVDGCHGKPCVILDFLALEAFTPEGAVVMFHDFSAEEYGMSQPHCKEGCDVPGACQELGLTNRKRQGWRQLETFTADKARGGWDMGVFEKAGAG